MDNVPHSAAVGCNLILPDVSLFASPTLPLRQTHAFAEEAAAGEDVTRGSRPAKWHHDPFGTWTSVPEAMDPERPRRRSGTFLVHVNFDVASSKLFFD